MIHIKTVIGIFENRDHVEMAIKELKNEGFESADLSIVMKDQRQSEEIAADSGTNVGGGAASGAATGAILGGFTGILASTVFPGLGLFLIGGPLATALGLTGIAASAVSGAATGAVAGGLLGALMNLGLSEQDAKTYEKRVNEGAILLAVPAEDYEETEVRSIFNDHLATDITVVYHENEAGTIDQSYEDRSEYGSDRPAYAPVGTKGGRQKSGRLVKTKKIAGSRPNRHPHFAKNEE